MPLYSLIQIAVSCTKVLALFLAAEDKRRLHVGLLLFSRSMLCWLTTLLVPQLFCIMHSRLHIIKGTSSSSVCIAIHCITIHCITIHAGRLPRQFCIMHSRLHIIMCTSSSSSVCITIHCITIHVGRLPRQRAAETAEGELRLQLQLRTLQGVIMHMLHMLPSCNTATCDHALAAHVIAVHDVW